MNIILMRHAECQCLSPGECDLGRKLVPPGCRDARRAAKFLTGIGIVPKTIITSPFKRSVDTGRKVASFLSPRPKVIVDKTMMPGAGLEEILSSATSRARCGRKQWILVVGHEPDISNAVAELLDTEQRYSIPILPATVIGIHIRIVKGCAEGDLAFSYSPMSFRDNQ